MADRSISTIKHYANGKELRSFNKRVFIQEKQDGDNYFYIVTVWKKIEGDPVKIKTSGWNIIRGNFSVRTFHFSCETLIDMFLLINEFKRDQITNSVQTKPAN